MEKWKGKTAVVAGGNSGIGYALTCKFLENEIYVYALDKDTNRLYELKNEQHGKHLTILQANVTAEAEVERCAKWLSENVSEINIYLHSVGIVGNNNLVDGEYTEWQNILNINMIGFCTCMKAIVNLMIKQNVQDGHIIIMNSIMSVEPVYVQELHYYGAIEHGVHALTEGLRHEVKERKSPIKISAIYAGLIRTNLYKNSIGEQFDTPLFKAFVTLNTDDIIDAMEHILSTPKDVLISKLVIAPRGSLKQHYFTT